MPATTDTEQFTALTVGRRQETEFRIDLHSPATGDSWRFLIYGNRQSSANLAALDYAREQTDDPSWRKLSILSEPSGGGMMAMSREDFFSDEF